MHPIIKAIRQRHVIDPDDMQDFHETRNRICKRFGISTRDYSLLCMAEATLHRWHEAECNGFIQRDDVGDLPWGYIADQYDCPIIRSNEPLPDDESKAIATARSIATEYGLNVYIQTDPRGCALHLYRLEDLDGRPIDECYSARATAVSYRC
jgi:hypothetical protein